VADTAAKLTTEDEAGQHRLVTRAVHEADGKIALQILHTGRYAFHENLVGPSAIKAPINFFKPHPLTEEEIEEQIQDFVNCARLAKSAGYDGVEVMGSEGPTPVRMPGEAVLITASAFRSKSSGRCEKQSELILSLSTACRCSTW
jgi:hypothetical protein